MPALAGNPVQEQKDFNPRVGAAMVIGGVALVDIAQIGYDASKDHDFTYTVDENLDIVDHVPEINATGVVHATSEAIDGLEALFYNSETFTTSIAPADDAGDGDRTLDYCRIQDFTRSEIEIDSMPTYEVNIQAGDVA